MKDIEKRRSDRWNFLFIAGMWFQDLFNYDFRRTEQCIIPYATQEGEISFCAYNTGVGWRNIIEKMHMTATLTKWYEEHGRHEIFAGGKKVGMTYVGHELKLNMEHVNSEANHTLDNLGIAKNAREEKLRARDTKIKYGRGECQHGQALSRTRTRREAGRRPRKPRLHQAGLQQRRIAHQPPPRRSRARRRRLTRFPGEVGFPNPTHLVLSPTRPSR